jgi:hypothetical protein
MAGPFAGMCSSPKTETGQDMPRITPTAEAMTTE